MSAHQPLPAITVIISQPPVGIHTWSGVGGEAVRLPSLGILVGLVDDAPDVDGDG